MFMSRRLVEAREIRIHESSLDNCSLGMSEAGRANLVLVGGGVDTLRRARVSLYIREIVTQHMKLIAELQLL